MKKYALFINTLIWWQGSWGTLWPNKLHSKVCESANRSQRCLNCWKYWSNSYTITNNNDWWLSGFQELLLKKSETGLKTVDFEFDSPQHFFFNYFILVILYIFFLLYLYLSKVRWKIFFSPDRIASWISCQEVHDLNFLFVFIVIMVFLWFSAYLTSQTLIAQITQDHEEHQIRPDVFCWWNKKLCGGLKFR